MSGEVSKEVRDAVVAALLRASKLLERQAKDAYDESAYGLADASRELEGWAGQYQRGGSFGEEG